MEWMDGRRSDGWLDKRTDKRIGLGYKSVTSDRRYDKRKRKKSSIIWLSGENIDHSCGRRDGILQSEHQSALLLRRWRRRG